MVIEVVKTLLSAKLVFFTNPGKGAFCVFSRLDCNSEGRVMQEVSDEAGDADFAGQ
jgi:hypothetical protein